MCKIVLFGIEKDKIINEDEVYKLIDYKDFYTDKIKGYENFNFYNSNTMRCACGSGISEWQNFANEEEAKNKNLTILQSYLDYQEKIEKQYPKEISTIALRNKQYLEKRKHLFQELNDNNTAEIQNKLNLLNVEYNDLQSLPDDLFRYCTFEIIIEDLEEKIEKKIYEKLSCEDEIEVIKKLLTKFDEILILTFWQDDEKAIITKEIKVNFDESLENTLRFLKYYNILRVQKN